jgi:uncharacterized protein YoxC
MDKKMTEKELNTKDKIIEEIQDLGGQIKDLGQEAKSRYDQSDQKTKNRIIAGLVAIVTLLINIFQFKRIKSLKKKMKENKED